MNDIFKKFFEGCGLSASLSYPSRQNFLPDNIMLSSKKLRASELNRKGILKGSIDSTVIQFLVYMFALNEGVMCGVAFFGLKVEDTNARVLV